MQTTVEIKDARIEFKTSKEIKTLLQDAASTLGMDLTSFLVSTATQRAKAVLKDERMLVLTASEWEAFEKHLADKQQPSDALREVMAMDGFDV